MLEIGAADRLARKPSVEGPVCWWRGFNLLCSALQATFLERESMKGRS